MTLPAAGGLALDGTAVTVDEAVTAAEIRDLVFTPEANANGMGYASFTFRVSDGTEESALAYIMTVNVTAVDDPATGGPTISGTAAGGRDADGGDHGHCGRGRPHQPDLRLPVDPGGRRRRVECNRCRGRDRRHLRAGGGGCRQEDQGERELHRRRGRRRRANQ